MAMKAITPVKKDSGIDDNLRNSMATELKKTLDEASKAYYYSNTPIMTDEEFDQTAILYKKLTGETYNTSTPAPEKLKKSSKKLVDTEHTFKNLLSTIDNKFQTLDDLFEWLESIFDKLNLNAKKDNLEILVSEKYDGNSVCIEYENGKAKVAPTRGKEGKGLNLIDVFKDDYLKGKHEDDYIGVKYEVMLSYENFDKLNKIKADNNDDTYANPRNTVAGLLSSDDAYKYRDFLTLVPISVKSMNNDLNRMDEIDYITENCVIGDIEFNGEIFEGNLEQLKADITEMYNRYIPLREKLGYMIDGLVIEVMDSSYKEELGYFTTGSPIWQSAVKFPYMHKASKVRDIIFEVSPNGSGRITPSVIFDPVYFNGAKMTKVSLANYKRFKELALCKGSKITVEYHNDVLCYVTRLGEDEEGMEPIPFATKCPCCGSKLKTTINIKNEETFVYCDNDKCKMRIIGKINNYINMVGIKGIDISTLSKIYDFNPKMLQTPADLYTLRYTSISNIVGEKTAHNVVDAIMDVAPNDYDVIAGLGIANIGKETAKSILDEFSIDQLADKNIVSSSEFETSLKNINGIGEILAKRFSTEMLEKCDLLEHLLSNVKIKATKREKALNQLIFVMTGDPNKSYFEKRDDVKAYIEERGHKMTGSVSKKTDYLITETPNSGTVKNKKAREFGIPIITCEELRELLG